MSAIPENVFLSVLMSVTILVLVFFVTLRSIVKTFRTGLDRLYTLSRIEAKINLLLEHAAIEFDLYKSLPQGVADAIRRDEKILAIKLWRAATGRLEGIEGIHRRGSAPKRTRLTAELPPPDGPVRQLVRNPPAPG